MTSPVPDPRTLREAVEEVIRQNKAVGYTPSRFITYTEGGAAANLLTICADLIQNPETYEWLEKAVESHPALLILEDLVTHSAHGREWGLGDREIILSEARSMALDHTVGFQRWIGKE